MKKKGGRPVGSKSVTAEEFVRAWQKAESPAAVSRMTGISLQGVASRAMALRKRGVPLKKMTRGRNVTYTTQYISNLKKLAKSLEPK